jgi:hypothetical protein
MEIFMKNKTSLLSLSVMLSFALICLIGSPDLMAGQKSRENRERQSKSESREREKKTEKRDKERKENFKKSQSGKSVK